MFFSLGLVPAQPSKKRVEIKDAFLMINSLDFEEVRGSVYYRSLRGLISQVTIAVVCLKC